MKRPRPASLLRRLTLQGRFAALAALGVAIAVVAASVICYFLVEDQLNRQIDTQLNPAQAGRMFQGGPGGHQLGGFGQPFSAESLAQALATCLGGGTDSSQPGGALPVQSGGIAITSASGQTCTQHSQNASSEFNLGSTATPTQIAVANGTEDGRFYDTYTTSGEHVRVFTQRPDKVTGFAVSNIASLAYIDSSLHSLAIELILASLGGILLAAAAGFLVARSALAPVRRLTRAAEHVAATDDLSVQLPVDGADELSRLGKAFNRMTRSLAGSRERQQRLIADAGHELRTPLTSLRTNVDLLLRSRRTGRALPPGREQAMLESVDQQLHELSGLVTDLLELSRNIEAGKRKTMQVALHESVGRAVARARLRGPGLEFDVEIEPWFVQGDPTGLDRAVVNLLDNAVKFSPAGGRITVRLRGGVYTVRDQGPGISPEDLPRVFERFYRSDSARQLPGSGLGLAIVAQVAEESGGTIRLLPAPGGGTLARLALPGGPADRAIEPGPTT
ncbi:sensor histidine kinase [Actinospica robiniae]|uniref:sensor histidine kinase n=1 Tax=Actinospica robiniae TaxID=304901 RepID=UPI0004118E48|nr:HAMP domain-containing sensor histidine kinase [Actinospica robiniae]